MGVYTFEFPADFNPMFQKDYEIAGNHFTVQVMELGILPKESAGAHACYMWAFRILVNGERVPFGKGNFLEGPYYWGIDKRRLNMENVANHLASYWGHDKWITDAQDLNGDVKLEVQLERIVAKCKIFLDSYLMQEGYDYDVLMSFLDENGGWTVIIQPNIPKLVDNRIFVFDHKASEEVETGAVNFHSYVLDRSLPLTF